jgi:hypothetical protein
MEKQSVVKTFFGEFDEFIAMTVCFVIQPDLDVAVIGL